MSCCVWPMLVVMTKVVRRAYWAFVSYQPREVILAGMVAAHVSCAIGPVHDRDVWGPDDLYNRIRSAPKGAACVLVDQSRVLAAKLDIANVGQVVALDIPNEGLKDLPQLLDVKKAHTHILLHYPRGVVAEGALDSLKGYLDVSYVEPVCSPCAYYRYLTHADSPDKAQYDSADIIHIGDITSALGDISSDSWETARSLMEYICSLPVSERSFRAVVDCMCARGRWEEVKELRAHPYYYKMLL